MEKLDDTFWSSIKKTNLFCIALINRFLGTEGGCHYLSVCLPVKLLRIKNGLFFMWRLGLLLVHDLVFQIFPLSSLIFLSVQSWYTNQFCMLSRVEPFHLHRAEKSYIFSWNERLVIRVSDTVCSWNACFHQIMRL